MVLENSHQHFGFKITHPSNALTSSRNKKHHVTEMLVLNFPVLPFPNDKYHKGSF